MIETAVDALVLGDSYMVDGMYDLALDAYTAALTLQDETTTTVLPVVRFRVLSHRSECLLRLERYTEALDDATTAISLITTTTTTTSTTTDPSMPSSDSAAAVESSVSFFADHPDQILRQHEMEMVWYRQGQSALFQQQQQQQLVVDHLPPSGSANNARYSVARLAFQNAAQLAHQNQRYHAEKIYREYHDKSIESPSVSSSSTLPPKVASSAVAVTTTDSSSSGNVGSSNSNNNLQTTKIIPPKYQYYQSDKYMTIAILEAKVQESDLQVDFRGSDDDDDATTIIAIHLRKQGQVFPVVAGTLCERIIAEQSKIQIKDEKVLVKLVKATPGKEWHDLLDTHRNKNKTKSSSKLTTPVATSTSTATALDNNNNHHPVQQATTTSSAATTSKNEKNQRPYASHKDWDRIEKEVLQEEESEKPQGDDALNKLFQQIYANADPDTRRAMIKSYQTSGGTCLSTNWKEVQSKDYEQQRTAPKGMEWKNWEGEKLPMESDDDGDD